MTSEVITSKNIYGDSFLLVNVLLACVTKRSFHYSWNAYTLNGECSLKMIILCQDLRNKKSGQLFSSESHYNIRLRKKSVIFPEKSYNINIHT